MSSSLRLGLFLLALTVVLAGGLYLLKSSAPQAPAPRPSRAPTSNAPPMATTTLDIGGGGGIEGEILFDGPPPPMLPLKVGADPICAKSDGIDEQVLVRDGKLRNVVVRIANGPSIPAPARALEVNQQECKYQPRIQAAVGGQTLVVRTSDDTLHNVHAHIGSSTLFNQAQPPRSRAIERALPENVGIVRLTCDVHPWMIAYVVVTNNSWFAVSGEDGRFHIDGVPAGELMLETWHERFGKKTRQVRITPNETLKVLVNYSLDDR